MSPGKRTRTTTSYSQKQRGEAAEFICRFITLSGHSTSSRWAVKTTHILASFPHWMLQQRTQPEEFHGKHCGLVPRALSALLLPLALHPWQATGTLQTSPTRDSLHLSWHLPVPNPTPGKSCTLSL